MAIRIMGSNWFGHPWMWWPSRQERLINFYNKLKQAQQ